MYDSTEPSVIYCIDNNTWIPCDLANSDYQAYLKWLEEGGVPTPADPLPADPLPAENT